MIVLLFILAGLAMLMLQMMIHETIEMIQGFCRDFDKNFSHDTNWFQDEPPYNFYDAF
jgi:hypothetical protein